MPKKPVVMNHQSIIWPDIFEGFSGPKHDQFANVVWKHCRILRARSKKSWRLRWLGTWKGGNSAKCGGGGLRFWGISGGRGFTRKWLVYQHQILVRNGIGCQNASESWFMWLSNTHLRVETAHEATLEGTEAKKTLETTVRWSLKFVGFEFYHQQFLELNGLQDMWWSVR